MRSAPTIHASCVVIGERGALIRGPSGSGKSSFSAALIELASSRGLFSRLVADDRVRLDATNGRLLAETPREIAGLIERRGLGVTRVPFLARAVVGLVVDIEDAVERMPEPAAFACEIAGVRLPRLAIVRGAPDGPALTLLGLNWARHDDGCCAMALALAGQEGKIKDMTATPSILQSGRAGVARRGPRPERNGICAETA